MWWEQKSGLDSRACHCCFYDILTSHVILCWVYRQTPTWNLFVLYFTSKQVRNCQNACVMQPIISDYLPSNRCLKGIRFRSRISKYINKEVLALNKVMRAVSWLRQCRQNLTQLWMEHRHHWHGRLWAAVSIPRQKRLVKPLPTVWYF